MDLPLVPFRAELLDIFISLRTSHEVPAAMATETMSNETCTKFPNRAQNKVSGGFLNSVGIKWRVHWSHFSYA